VSTTPPSAATRLLQALAQGDASTVETLVTEDRRLLTAQDELGRGLVILAVYSGQPALAWELVRRGSPEGIHEAAALGDMLRAGELLKKDPGSVEAWSVDGWTPLHLAAFFGHAGLCTLLVDRGALVGAVSRNVLANQPLHAAAAGGHLGSVQALLSRGADARSSRSREGSTPLHIAADLGEDEVVRALLGAGAEVAALNDKGLTPVEVARRAGHWEIAELLLRHGAQDLPSPPPGATRV
jgi:uncharacterized protein